MSEMKGVDEMLFNGAIQVKLDGTLLIEQALAWFVPFNKISYLFK